MENNQLPDDAQQPAQDYLLEDMARLTGLFNPEIIWQEEMHLDDLAEKDVPPATEQPHPHKPAS